MLKQEKYRIGLYLIFSVTAILSTVTIWVQKPNVALMSSLILFLFLIILFSSKEYILVYLYAGFFWLSRSVYFNPLSPANFLSGADVVEILVYIVFLAWLIKNSLLGSLKDSLRSIFTAPFLLPLIIYSLGGINAFLIMIQKYPADKDVAVILVRKNCLYAILVYFLCSRFIKNTSQLGRFMIAMVIGGCIVGSRYLYLFKYHPSMLYGTREALRLGGKIAFGKSVLNINALGIGTYLATLIPLSSTFFLFSSSRFKKYIGLFTFFYLSYFTVLTGSRSCWAAAIVGIGTVIILGRKYLKANSIKFTLFIGLIVVGGLLVLNYGTLNKYLLTRIESLRNISKDMSLLDRFKIWEDSLRLLFSHPSGMSFSSFYKYVYLKTTPHNTFLAIGITHGIIGLFGIIWFVFAWFKKMFSFVKTNSSEDKILYIGAIASIVSFLISSSFDSYNYYSLIIGQIWSIFGATTFIFCKKKIE